MYFLHRLKYLNLDNNEIFTIPHLKLLGTSPLKPAKSTEQMTYTSSSLDGTPALIHSSTALPVSREEGGKIDQDTKENVTKTEERSAIGAKEEVQVVAGAGGTTATKQGEESDGDPRATKNEPSLVLCQNTEDASEEKNSSERAIPSDVTNSEKLSKSTLHSEVPHVKSEPSILHQSTKIDSKVEAKVTSGEDIEQKILPDSEVTLSGRTTPPLDADISTPPAQIDQSARTSPKSDMEKEGRVGNLQPVSGDDEKSKELAPFPQLETLSLVNNLVSKSLR